jgi:hypothetical protein
VTDLPILEPILKGATFFFLIGTTQVYKETPYQEKVKKKNMK